MNAIGITPRSGQPTARAEWRKVVVPTEHGGWGLTAEPVLLGLLVAPSGAGAALGAAAVVAFCARTPLKLVLVDAWRGRMLPRTKAAAAVALAEVAVLGALVAIAAVLATASFWAPLALAVPLVVLELWFDMRSRSRRLLPELAGTVGIGSVGAAIVLADSGGVALAAGVWVVIAARAVASLPFVRFQLARRRGAEPVRRAQDLAQVLAVGLVVVGVGAGWLPWGAALAIGLLALVQVVLARMEPPRAAIVGAQQLVLGLAVVVTAGLSMVAP
jgi:hypothetical protein